jgi:hypothetical protein
VQAESQRSLPGVAELVRGAIKHDRGRPRRAFNQVRPAWDTFKGVVRDRLSPFQHREDFDLQLSHDPFTRLFETDLGRTAAHLIGNESRTLDVIQTLSVDIVLEAARRDLQIGPEVRTLFVPGLDGLPPTLLLLDPALRVGDTRQITDEVPIGGTLAASRREEPSPRSDEGEVRRLFLSDPENIRTLLRIAQPEIVISRAPKMERLCVPLPLLRVETATDISTAGILCRDSDGRKGVTACYHGTGPVGTKVTVAGRSSEVALANIVQDIVFIPLPEAEAAGRRDGIAGVLRGRTPAQYDAVRFDGATSGETVTNIQSHDAALLRDRPSVQLKVQTAADANKGDSGSALIDRDGKVIGFAFETSAFDEIPQITDWIWAANALRSLGLEPL